MRLSIQDYEGLSSIPPGKELILNAGELVLLRGDSGAGKTRLLLRILDLDSEPIGRIEIDGETVG